MKKLQALVAAGILAVTGCQTNSPQSTDAQDKSSKPAALDAVLLEAAHLHHNASFLVSANREEGQQYWAKAERLLLEQEKTQPSNKIDFLLADLYTKRNKPANGDAPCDREKAIPRWERLMNEKPSKELTTPLMGCYATVANERFLESQMLSQFGTAPESDKQILKGIFKVETREQAEALTDEKLLSFIQLLETAGKYSKDAGGVGIVSLQFKDSPHALVWYRRMIKVAPDMSFGYRYLVKHYEGQGSIGHVLDELKVIPEYLKEPKLIDTVIDLLDERRKMGLRPKQTPDHAGNLKVALLLYQTSAERWAREMKKEDMTDRNYVAAVEEAFIAGVLDYHCAKTDEGRASALRRLEGTYNLINSGMDNGLGRLDKMFEHTVTRNKITVEGADIVSEALKERYTPKKESQKKDF